MCCRTVLTKNSTTATTIIWEGRAIFVKWYQCQHHFHQSWWSTRCINSPPGYSAPFPPQSPTWDATRTPKSDLLYFAQNIANRNMGRTRKKFTVLFGNFSQMAATFDFLLKLGWSSTSPDIELLVRNFDIFDIVWTLNDARREHDNSINCCQREKRYHRFYFRGLPMA